MLEALERVNALYEGEMEQVSVAEGCPGQVRPVKARERLLSLVSRVVLEGGGVEGDAGRRRTED